MNDPKQANNPLHVVTLKRMLCELGERGSRGVFFNSCFGGFGF